MTPTGLLETLVEFTGNGVGNKGSIPVAGLMQAIDGNLYGTTAWGGISNRGTIFMMTPSGTLTTLVEFTENGVTNRGSHPHGRLMQSGDGEIYGTTLKGGTNDLGTVFKMTSNGVLTTLIEFSGEGAGSKGGFPIAGLIQGYDGAFYGTTSGGTASEYATIFKITSNGKLTTLYDFANDSADSAPLAQLYLGTDGNLYGTTRGGALGGDGSIFRLVFPGAPNVFPMPAGDAQRDRAHLRCSLIPRGGATIVSIEFGTDGILFQNCVPVAQSFTGLRLIPVGRTLGDLTPGTTYYYRFRASNRMGQMVSQIQSFSTLAEPLVSAEPVTDIAATRARLSGTVNARNHDATVSFEYGPDTNPFPNRVTALPTVVTGNVGVAVSAIVEGLVPGQIYFYRLVAANAGGLAVSEQRSFRTPSPPTADIGAIFAQSTTSARVNGRVNAYGWRTEVVLEFGNDGVNFPHSVVTTPSTINAETGEVSASLRNLVQNTKYYCRLRAESLIGIGLSAVRTIDLGVLSAALPRIIRTQTQADGALLIEYSTLTNRTYEIQYSSDLKEWKKVLPRIVGTGTPLVFLDYGFPITESRPSDAGVRFYRVLLMEGGQ